MDALASLEAMSFTSLQHGQDLTPVFHVANAFGLVNDEPTDEFLPGTCEALLGTAGRAVDERSLLIHRWARDTASELQASLAVAYTQLDRAVVAALIPTFRQRLRRSTITEWSMIATSLG